MKILLTGGGTGGHFYPLIAIAEELNNIAVENRLLRPQIYFMSSTPYNEGMLYKTNITFVKTSAGKIRRQKSVQNTFLNALDTLKTFMGVITAVWKLFWIFPDVVFGKGGYVSFPALFAARILGIPVVIHESDSVPGKVNAWAGKFAKRVAVSYPQAVSAFKSAQVAFTGNPIRKEIEEPLTQNASEFLGLDPKIPTIFVLGGSQGSQFINEVVLDALPDLVKSYQVIHQTGKLNIEVVRQTSNIILQGTGYESRYKAYDYMDALTMRMSAGMANLIISRAGSTIFEIACWGKPSIIVPIPEDTSHDQRSNAYAYARSGSAMVIEQKNLSAGVLVSELKRLFENKAELDKMAQATSAFARKDSARVIAQELTAIALSHE